MPRGAVEKNSFEYIEYENEKCVRFTTVGKHKFSVIVDKNAWEKYLCEHTWSVSIDTKSGRASVKTSIENQTVFLWRYIIEHEKDELDYWGTTIDHINNNPLDNRLSSALHGADIYRHVKENKIRGVYKWKKSETRY